MQYHLQRFDGQLTTFFTVVFFNCPQIETENGNKTVSNLERILDDYKCIRQENSALAAKVREGWGSTWFHLFCLLRLKFEHNTWMGLKENSSFHAEETPRGDMLFFWESIRFLYHENNKCGWIEKTIRFSNFRVSISGCFLRVRALVWLICTQMKHDTGQQRALSDLFCVNV